MRIILRFLACPGVVAWWLFTAATVGAAEWVLPLAGEPVVTRPFDPPRTPYGPGHRGVDLAGAPGQPVFAAGAGTIGYAAPLAGRGVVTVVHLGGLRTTYEPVAAAVQVGQLVPVGHPIGALEPGHRGCPVAACLHWGLLEGEVYLDPMSLLGLGPIRLLPSTDVGPASSAGGDEFGTERREAARYSDEESAAGQPVPDRMATAIATAAGIAVGAAILLVRGRPP